VHRTSVGLTARFFVFVFGCAQCAREGFSENLEKQKGEGCQVYGHILVNKVRVLSFFFFSFKTRTDIINYCAAMMHWPTGGGQLPLCSRQVVPGAPHARPRPAAFQDVQLEHFPPHQPHLIRQGVPGRHQPP
jgi:hypothetical protein